MTCFLCPPLPPPLPSLQQRDSTRPTFLTSPNGKMQAFLSTSSLGVIAAYIRFIYLCINSVHIHNHYECVFLKKGNPLSLCTCVILAS